MQNSKLIHLLQSLSKPELNKLEEYIYSPYFNKNQNVRALFDILYKSYPKFKDEEITRNIVYNQIFSTDQYDEQKLRYLMSDLTKLIENFLMDQQMADFPHFQNHVLLLQFQKRNLIKYSQATIEQSNALQTKNKYLNADYYLNQFTIEVDNYEYVSMKRNVAIKENLLEIIRNLDIYYIINKLKYSCEIINHTNVWAGEYDPLLLEEIIIYLKKNKHDHIPAVAIYYQILMTLLKSDEEDHYLQLKQLLKDNIKILPQEELNDMYIFARNYCVKKINSGKINYLKELLDLYKVLLQNGIILQN